jgi:hypothetical protein
MVKQRFLVLFRHWFFTAARVFGPILGYELFVSVRQYFQYLPVSLVELLMGAGGVLLTIALLCWLWAWGEWWWSKLSRLRGFCGELRRCSRDYWKPEAVRANRA